MLQEVKCLVTAKGKSVQVRDIRSEDKETILKHVMGPSGNLRAPTLRLGSTLLVGFHPEMYEQYLI